MFFTDEGGSAQIVASLMGMDVGAARARLKDLVARGVSFDAAEMKQAYQDFAELERQHLELREELLWDGGNGGPISGKRHGLLQQERRNIASPETVKKL